MSRRRSEPLELQLTAAAVAEVLVTGAGVCVHTIQAKCGNSSDEARLVELIMKQDGGFDSLDKVWLASCLSNSHRIIQLECEINRTRHIVFFTLCLWYNYLTVRFVPLLCS